MKKLPKEVLDNSVVKDEVIINSSFYNVYERDTFEEDRSAFIQDLYDFLVECSEKYGLRVKEIIERKELK